MEKLTTLVRKFFTGIFIAFFFGVMLSGMTIGSGGVFGFMIAIFAIAMLFMLVLPFVAWMRMSSENLPLKEKGYFYLIILFLASFGFAAEMFGIILKILHSPAVYDSCLLGLPKAAPPIFTERVVVFFAGYAASFIYITAAVFLFSLIALLIISVIKKREGFGMPQLLYTVLGVVLIVSLLIIIIGESLNSVRVKSRDGRRISDAKQMQLALELYLDHELYDKDIPSGEAGYPKVTGETSAERWASLASFIESAGAMASVPNDPCDMPERSYDYSNTPDGKGYVVRVLLENPENFALDSSGFYSYNNDLDGEVLGIWCGEEGWELEYCVGP